MTINELARAVHENAVSHGWWDEERSMAEVIALIHSEWSEALEEARAGRPLVWYDCNRARGNICDYVHIDCDYRVAWRCDITDKPKKPEGIAVELIDGCIRILDAFGQYDFKCGDNEHDKPMEIESLWTDEEIPWPDDALTGTMPNLVAWLHAVTSETVLNDDQPAYLLAAMSLAMKWVYAQGIDPLKLLLAKHEYNKTRPYKHGKKF